MNRNDQVNSEKMWEYIRNIGKAIRKYRTGIAVTGFFIAMPFIGGCSEPLVTYPSTNNQQMPGCRNGSHYPIGYWQMKSDIEGMRRQQSIEELRRIEREAALSGARIRAHTRKMLYEMQLRDQVRRQQHRH